MYHTYNFVDIFIDWLLLAGLHGLRVHVARPPSEHHPAGRARAAGDGGVGAAARGVGVQPRQPHGHRGPQPPAQHHRPRRGRGGHRSQVTTLHIFLTV